MINAPIDTKRGFPLGKQNALYLAHCSLGTVGMQLFVLAQRQTHISAV